MLAFIIEVAILCILFTISCIDLTDRMMKDLERAKLDYPEAIVQRLIREEFPENGHLHWRRESRRNGQSFQEMHHSQHRGSHRCLP
jgi:hypothetical protein